jgi:hypothetical protein
MSNLFMSDAGRRLFIHSALFRQEDKRLGLPWQSLIKIWIAEKLQAM